MYSLPRPYTENTNLDIFYFSNTRKAGFYGTSKTYFPIFQTPKITTNKKPKSYNMNRIYSSYERKRKKKYTRNVFELKNLIKICSTELKSSPVSSFPTLDTV